jgi:hypothetical protein
MSTNKTPAVGPAGPTDHGPSPDVATSRVGGECAKLRLSFDPERLRRDLDVLRRARRSPQPGSYHDGEWVGVVLRSPGGKLSSRPSLPSLAPYEDTALLKRTPYFREVLQTLRAPQLSVRLLSLPPGGVIREHSDEFVGFWHGVVRLHLPIVTHRAVRFLIGGRRCDMSPGELWYGDFARMHSVSNESPVTRVHMVIDLLVNRFLLGLFPRGFVKRHLGDAITHWREAPAASERELQSYACTFFVPAELVSMFSYISRFDAGPEARTLVEEASRTGLVSRIRVIDGQLYLVALNRVLLRLVPVTGEACAPAGWSHGFMLHLERDGGAVRGVRLELRHHAGGRLEPLSNLIPLPVLEF